MKKTLFIFIFLLGGFIGGGVKMYLRVKRIEEQKQVNLIQIKKYNQYLFQNYKKTDWQKINEETPALLQQCLLEVGNE